MFWYVLYMFYICLKCFRSHCNILQLLWSLDVLEDQLRLEIEVNKLNCNAINARHRHLQLGCQDGDEGWNLAWSLTEQHQKYHQIWRRVTICYVVFIIIFSKDVSSCDMWSFPNGKAHAEESGGGLSPRLSRYERGTKWTQPTLTITNSCTQCTTHLNRTRSSRFCTRIDLILCRHFSSHGSQGHSCARQMPSSGAVELADVKRDWWCTSFPAALLDILRFPELQREGKGRVSQLSSPWLWILNSTCLQFFAKASNSKTLSSFPSRRCCPHPWKRWFCNPRQIHKMNSKWQILWGTKNSDPNYPKVR